jgi:hypothetical protein
MEYLKAEGINYAGTIPKIKMHEDIEPCQNLGWNILLYYHSNLLIVEIPDH